MAKRGATGRGGPHPVADRRRDKSRDGEERRKRGRGAKSVELFRKRREPASQEGGGGGGLMTPLLAASNQSWRAREEEGNGERGGGERDTQNQSFQKRE